jgi:ribosomal protein L37E
MGMIPQVICRRCGEKYSAARRRCPKCGTRRVQNSRRAPGTTPDAVKGTAANRRAGENRKWQLIFGAILIVAIIAALIVMITVSLENADNPNAPVLPTAPAEVTAVPTPTPTPSPTPTPTPEITSVSMSSPYASPCTEFAFQVGQTITLTGSHFPMTVSAEYQWSSSDSSIASVTANENGSCTVTAVSAGTVKITLECYGKTAECTVYVRN